MRPVHLLALLALLAACGDGQPLFDEGTGGGDATDTDGDGLFDAQDPDDDGDGIADEDEADGDGDGLIDDRDTDDDNDGIADGDEADTDGDGLIDDRDPDDDGDGIADGQEPDLDGDGVIDDRDPDDDDDGIGDGAEADLDGDGVIDDRDPDDDGDGIADGQEPDLDGDGLIDDVDPDDDNDGILDVNEGDLPGGFNDTGGLGAIPASIAGNLSQVSYDAATDTLEVTIRSLDSTPLTATYARNDALDVPGYAAFSVQEDPLDRMFIALTRASDDGSVSGGVVADGGQFNVVFGGAYYRREGPYAPPDPQQPDGGLVSYAGDYAGLTNINAPRPGEILPVPAGTDEALIPGQPSRVTGQVFINADFADNTVNGAIYDREIVDSSFALADVFLVPTDIASNGTFQGEAQDPALEVIGEYAGAFGGESATAVAGGIAIENYIEEVENEIEWGSFVLTACGQPGDATICADVEPDVPDGD